MNVQEMHLAIQQGVDKINSLQADLLLPQEIDTYDPFDGEVKVWQI